MKNEISEKELLDFLNDLKNEVSSSKFWDNLDEDVAKKYDDFSSVELIAEFVVDYIIEKVKEKLKENELLYQKVIDELRKNTQYLNIINLEISQLKFKLDEIDKKLSYIKGGG
jgi:hypothetical protein